MTERDDPAQQPDAKPIAGDEHQEDDANEIDDGTPSRPAGGVRAADLSKISFPKTESVANLPFRPIVDLSLTSFDPSTVFTPRPDGGFNIEQHKAEQRAASAAHKQQQEAAEAHFRRDLETKRYAQRLLHERIMFFGVVAVLAGTLVLSLAVALLADDPGRQEWAQTIVVLIIGGVVGGLAGYITGQSSR